MLPRGMKNRLFCFVFGMFLSLQAFAQEGGKNYWKDTGLKAAHFEEDILSGCSADAIHFVGCVEALNSMGLNLAEPRILIPGKDLPVLKGKVRKVLSEPGKGMVVRSLDPKARAQFRMTLSDTISQKKVNEVSGFEQILIFSMLESVKSNPSILEFDFRPLFREWIRDALNDENMKAAGEAALLAELYRADFKVTDDPHKELFATAAMKAMIESDSVEYSGVGFETVWLKRGVFISRVLENSPAAASGIIPGDELVAVDGERVDAMVDSMGDSIVEPRLTFKIRGPDGSKVKFGMKRGKTRFDVTVTRGKIKSGNVTYSILDWNNRSYGYIQILSFMSRETAAETAAALISLRAAGAEKFLLDLRNNGGGSLEEAVLVASLFLNSREVVHVENLATHEESPLSGYYSHQDEKAPLVVLVNFLSASASEVVAGALQEYGRAWVVGDRTFGKGIVQNVDLFHPERYGGAILLKQTSHIYRYPSGRTPHLSGVIPDFRVTEYPGGELIDPVTLREKDLYVGTLPDAKAWRLGEQLEPRESKIRSISQCRQETGSADQQWKAWNHGGTGIMDYRLMVGLDILACVQK
jgi:carboxyl-terminal processing protease